MKKSQANAVVQRLKTTPELASEQAVRDFIKSAQQANPFGPVEWGAVCWEVPNTARSSHGRKTERIWFNAEFVAKSTYKNAVPFPTVFDDFVKAVTCYRQANAKNGLATEDHGTSVRAFRYLKLALGLSCNDPLLLRKKHFDMALNQCQDREKPSSQYRIGLHLENIARVMDRNHLGAVRLNWVNPISRDDAVGGFTQQRIGPEFEARRNEKLPSMELIEAIGKISQRTDLADPDLLRQRMLELLFCGGFRATEEICTPADCWIEEPQLDEDGIPLLGPGGLPIVYYGLRTVPAKNGHELTRIKPIPTAMIDVARRAYDDAIRLTEKSRAVARFQATNPGRTLLPKPWRDRGLDDLLSLEELCEIVGFTGGKRLGSARQFAERAGMKAEDRYVITRRKLEAYLAMRSSKPVIYPRGQNDMRLQECLFVVPVNYFHGTRAALNGTVSLVTDTMLADYLAGRPGVSQSSSDWIIATRMANHFGLMFIWCAIG